MREKIIPAVLLALTLFVEVSLTSLPFLVGVLIFLAVTYRKDWVFPAAVLVGLVFDILTLRTIGTTSIFLALLVFLIFIYENKFETETVPFVFISTFIASFIFLIFLGFSNLVAQSLIVAFLTALLFRLSSITFGGRISS